MSRSLTGCCVSNRGETEVTAVSVERGWKDFISFWAVRINPSVRRTPPLYFVWQQNTREEVIVFVLLPYCTKHTGCYVSSIGERPKKRQFLWRGVEKISWVFWAIRINLSVRRTSPLYFAMQNTGEENNTFLYIVRLYKSTIPSDFLLRSYKGEMAL